MATLDDVDDIVAELPQVTEVDRHGNRAWAVADKVFAWERQFSKADLKRFGGDPVPAGPVLAVSVADLAEKEAVLAEGAPGVFTIPHFNGYAAVLVELPEVPPATLRDLLVDGWRARAPRALAEGYQPPG